MSDIPVLLLILLFIAFLLRIDFIYYVAYVMAGIYLWSNWYGPRSLRMIHSYRSFSKRAFIGEAIDVSVVLKNKSRLPALWIQLYESIPPELRDGPALKSVVSVGSKKEKRLSYRVRAAKRGYYKLGPLQFTTGDLFGLRENSERLESDYLTIYPRIVPVTSLGVPSKLPFGTMASKQRIYEDPARPIGMREYNTGDSLRHINWKVSAHQSKLLVKTYQPSMSLETMIVLNLNVDDFNHRFRVDGPEWAIVIAASLAAHLARKQQAVGLATNGPDPLLQQGTAGIDGLLFDDESGRLSLNMHETHSSTTAHESAENNGLIASPLGLVPMPIRPATGQIHFLKILELLARIEARPAVQVPGWIHNACLGLNWGVTLLVITPSGDDATCRSLHRLLRSGFNPVLIIAEPYRNFPEVKQRAQSYGFPAYHLADRHDLQT